MLVENENNIGVKLHRSDMFFTCRSYGALKNIN